MSIRHKTYFKYAVFDSSFYLMCISIRSVFLCLGFALEMKHRIINPEHETLCYENKKKEKEIQKE